MKMITISKSRFLHGVQCPKWLYIETHHPDMIPPEEEALEALFETGRQVGLLATKMFRGGQMVEWEDGGYAGAVKATKGLLADRNVPAIFEAAFEVDGLRIKADIMSRRPRSWELLEVKQGTESKRCEFVGRCFSKIRSHKGGR